MTTCDSGYAQMHYFQIQLLISAEREPFYRYISIALAALKIVSNSSHTCHKIPLNCSCFHYVKMSINSVAEDENFPMRAIFYTEYRSISSQVLQRCHLPLLKQIYLWTAQVIISDHSNFLSWKRSTFKVVIWNDADLLDIALSQVQLLSAASSTPLLTTLSCTSHFTKGRSCIFTERPKLLYSSYSLHPPASSTSILHNRPFLHFCRTVTQYLFLQKRHSTRTFLQNS